MPPQAIVNAVYRVPCDESELRADLLDYYGSVLTTYPADVSAFIDRVVPLVFVDVSVSDADAGIDVDQFTQEMPLAPKGAWQAPFAEALLSADADVVIARWHGCVDGLRDCRLGFYFHYYDPSQPMQWSYGAVECPAVEPANESLLSLVPYEPA
jgi:hypothetical protein